MNAENEKKIFDVTALLVDCFFESFDLGAMSDLVFQEKYNVDGSFPKMKMFHGADFSCFTADALSSSILAIKTVEIISEKFNDYLINDFQELSLKFSEYDESVSDDYFLRTVDKIPQETDVSGNISDWLLYVWGYVFGCVSSYEKTGSYARELYVKNSEQYKAVRHSIDNANKQVKSIIEIVGQDKGTESTGLFKKTQNLESRISGEEKRIDEVKTGIYNTTVSILGIFTSIVLTFSGALSFSSATLENINKASIYRLIGIVSLVGIVIFNLIICLVIYLLKGAKISDEKFSALKFYLPIWIVDTILVALLLFSFFAWKGDWLKKDSQDHIATDSQQSSCTSDFTFEPNQEIPSLDGGHVTSDVEA